MYEDTKTCMACWNGTYNEAGICSSCQKKIQAEEQRGNTLPARHVLNNRYIIGDVLGQGGFGVTYSAWDTIQNQRVALKELFPEKTKCVYRGEDKQTVVVLRDSKQDFLELKEKFKSEAELLKLLEDQKNIVRVYDIFSCHNTIYYSMEYLEGSDLNRYRHQHGRFTWDELKPIVTEILKTLASLHKQNLIHRDISPDNIFLTKDHTARLIDFGSARTYKGNSYLTIQKKEYFAPMEQMRTDGNQGPWTDIYALSITMYLLLTGKLPPATVDRYQGEREIPLGQFCPDIPEKIVKAIERGMEPKLEKRFQSAEEYMEALGIPYSNPTSMSTTNGPVTDPGKITTGGVQAASKKYYLYGRKGQYSGKRRRVFLNQEIAFGRDSANQIVFSSTAAGVSRNQCRLRIAGAGDWYVRDAGSTFGTFINGEKIGQNWVKVTTGDYLRFGEEIFQLMVEN